MEFTPRPRSRLAVWLCKYFWCLYAGIAVTIMLLCWRVGFTSWFLTVFTGCADSFFVTGGIVLTSMCGDYIIDGFRDHSTLRNLLGVLSRTAQATVIWLAPTLLIFGGMWLAN